MFEIYILAVILFILRTRGLINWTFLSLFTLFNTTQPNCNLTNTRINLTTRQTLYSPLQCSNLSTYIGNM